ncbi:TlpA family protein disulfide reductase [Ferrimonas marina]|uniref:Thiol-disulfide isomerase or thioredoxin n=1 Tax=Ferrimonas marina TaxID=299255 RepID=A0A1M5ZRE6_9GAMM|nr:TlpA disulfide reductase family protein [Ferrimonas marina]SHI26810.1 Thiol-disulfide isomerase or thioredoxin [Ferrimonas marina]
MKLWLLVLALVSGSAMAYPGASSNETDPALERFIHLSRPQSLESVQIIAPDGAPFDLSQFKGQPVMINLWATWCPPCIRELPSLERFRQDFEPRGLQVAPVSIDRDITVVKPFLEELGIADLETWYDTSNQIGKILPTDLIPASFILDAEGNLVGFVRSFIDWDSPAVRATMEQYLPEAAAQ